MFNLTLHISKTFFLFINFSFELITAKKKNITALLLDEDLQIFFILKTLFHLKLI